MRYWLILLLFLIGAWWWRRKKRDKNAAHTTQPTGQAEVMVHCQHCGLHLPKTEALASNGAFFCSPDHQQRARP